MPHPAGLLKVTPKELNFPPPLNRVITNILKLHNISSEYAIAYKVKTTAPQRYCVRPNSGVLPPGETIEVQVLLNYVKDTPTSLDCKDKFQIQSILLKDPSADLKEVWAKATEDQIIKQKLKARFTQPAATKTLVEDDSEKDIPSLITSHTDKIGDDGEPSERFQGKVEGSPPQQYFSLSSAPEVSPPTAAFSEQSQEDDSLKYRIPEEHVSIPTTNVGSQTLIDAHVSLRKALDQNIAISSERDILTKQNNALSEQIRQLSEHVRNLEQQQQLQQQKILENNKTDTGLHYRGQHKVTGESNSVGISSAHAPAPVHYKPLLLLLFMVAIFAFLLGKSYA